MKRMGAAWAVLAMVGLIAGCGESVEGPKIGETVTYGGTVTMDGKPLDGALVTFHPKSKDGHMGASGLTDASGKYTLKTYIGEGKTKDGVVPGRYNVTVSRMVDKDGKVVPYDPNTPPMADPSVHEQIPLKYSAPNDMGPYTEVQGAGNYDFEVSLKDDA